MHSLMRFCVALLVVVLMVPGVAGAVEMRTYTADELGFMASSHLIIGDDAVILVDAQFTRAHTWEVVDMIKASERPLTMIFVTSPRPERYFGLAVLRNHFPEVRIVARPSTAETIAAEGQAMIDRWRPIYLDDIPAEFVVPEALEDDVLTLGDENIEIYQADGDDAPASTVLYLPGAETLIATDFAFGGVHPLLEGTDPGALASGLATLKEKLGQVTWVYPGWGDGGGERLLEESRVYLEALRAALDSDREGAVRIMREAYPAYRMPVFLKQTVRAALIRPSTTATGTGD